MPKCLLLLQWQVEQLLRRLEDGILDLSWYAMAYQREESHAHASVPNLSDDPLCVIRFRIVEIRGNVDGRDVEVMAIRGRADTHGGRRE